MVDALSRMRQREGVGSCQALLTSAHSSVGLPVYKKKKKEILINEWDRF